MIALETANGAQTTTTREVSVRYEAEHGDSCSCCRCTVDRDALLPRPLERILGAGHRLDSCGDERLLLPTLQSWS